MRPNEKTPSRSNLCEARQRLGVEPVRRVFELVVHPLATPETPGAFYKGYRLMGIDGTVMDVPDSPANEERFGRSSGGRGDAAFPQIRKLSLVELGTHVETALAIGGYHDSEQKLVVQLFDKIPDDALLLEDRNFFSYDHWKELDSRGVKLLVRIKSNMILKPIERLPDGSCLAKVYPSSYDRDKDRKGIVVRVIEYTLDDPLRTGHGETHRLLTNLLDYMMFPAMELICLYHERWEEEQVYDEQKTHQDPRRPTKPAHFRSQTPEGVEQEIYALSLAHFVVRALMLEAAKQENQDADRLSFTGCFQILQARLPECQSSTPAELEQWYRLLLEEMAQERTEPRRNRINPRVVRQDVEVRQETSRASRPTDAYENLCSVSGYHLTNGIGLKPYGRNPPDHGLKPRGLRRVQTVTAYPSLGIPPPPPGFLLESAVSPPGDLTAKDLRWQHRFGVTHGVWMESDDIRGTEVLAELADPVLGRIFRHLKQVSQGARWRLVRYPQPLPFAWVALRAFEVGSWEPLFTTLTQRDRSGEAWFIHGEGPPEADFRSRHSLEDFVAKNLPPRAFNTHSMRLIAQAGQPANYTLRGHE